MDYAVRDYVEGDLGDAGATWPWALDDNPAGRGVAKVVTVGDQVVGGSAVALVRVQCGGETVVVGRALRPVVQPDHRRQDIETAAALACYEALDVPWVDGLVDPAAAGALERRLSWSLIARPPVHIKPLDLGRFVAERIKRPRLAAWLSLASRNVSRGPGMLASARARVRGRVAIDVVACSSFDDWADTLWARCRDQYRLWVVRDRDYLAWRYERRPGLEPVILRAEAGKVTVGYAVLGVVNRDEGRVCRILDLMVDTAIPAALPALLGAIEDQARGQGCAFASAVIPKHTRHRAALLEHAYLPVPPRPELYFGGRTVRDGALDPFDARAWCVSWGDKF